MTCIADVSAQARERLRVLSETPEYDVQLLLCAVLNCTRSYLYTWPEKLLDESQQLHFEALLTRRLQGEPVAYILGQQGFWSLDLNVAPGVLIPRTATETLIEVALQRCQKANARVLDLGTGSGAIACALASECQQWQLLAVEQSAVALGIAQDNIDRLALANVSLLQSDWYNALGSEQRFNMIVSNPPYIAPNDPHLDRGDLRFEPRSALAAEAAGLADLNLIIAQAPNYLLAEGLLVLEHGFDQASAVEDMLLSHGFTDIALAKDSDGLPRISSGVLRQ